MEQHLKPLVSIIIPTYNRAGLLPRSIESCLRQTYQNIEIIVVDDCSRDNTREVAQKYCNQDKRIVYIRNDKNEGAAHTRNAGIERSRGEFLAFLDDDCEYLPEKIDTEIALMHSLSPRPSIIYSNMWREQKEAKTIYSLERKDKFVTPGDIFDCKYHFLEPTTWFIKKDFIRNNMFDRDLYIYEDMDIMMRAVLAGESVYFYNKPLSIKHAVAGLTTLSSKYVLCRERFLKKHLPRVKKYKKYVSRFCYTLGKEWAQLGEYTKAKKYFWQAFLYWPIKVEYLFKIIELNYKKSECR